MVGNGIKRSVGPLATLFGRPARGGPPGRGRSREVWARRSSRHGDRWPAGLALFQRVIRTAGPSCASTARKTSLPSVVCTEERHPNKHETNELPRMRLTSDREELLGRLDDHV